MNNEQMMIAAAKRAAAGTRPLPLDDEVEKITNRGWLREDLIVDPKRLARSSLVMAVERGLAEQEAVRSQSTSLAQWKSLSDAAKTAAKSLNSLTKLSKFTIGDLQLVCTKQYLASQEFSESVTAAARAAREETPGIAAKSGSVIAARRAHTAALRAVQRGAHGIAMQLYADITAACQAAHTIADQADAMAAKVAKLKYDPGEPFRRGFAVEMMKTWWLLTNRVPSSKKSESGNPYAAFADGGMQSINSNPNVPSCSGVTRSALAIFQEWKNSSLSANALDEITILENTGDTPPGRNRGE